MSEIRRIGFRDDVRDMQIVRQAVIVRLSPIVLLKAHRRFEEDDGN